MGWLDSVKNFVQTAANNAYAGANPEAVLKKAQLMDEFKNSALRRQLEQSQEGRAAEQNDYGKTQRFRTERASDTAEKAAQGQIGLVGAETTGVQNKNAAFDASGGAAGEADRVKRGFDTELAVKRANIAHLNNAMKVANSAQELAVLKDKRDALTNELQRGILESQSRVQVATEPSQIEAEQRKASGEMTPSQQIAEVQRLLTSPNVPSEVQDRAAEDYVKLKAIIEQEQAHRTAHAQEAQRASTLISGPRYQPTVKMGGPRR